MARGSSVALMRWLALDQRCRLIVVSRRFTRGLKGLSSGDLDRPEPLAERITGVHSAGTCAPLPASPSAPAPAKAPVVLNTPADVQRHVQNLTPDEEAAFWKAQGLKWDAPRNYKALF